MLCEYFSLPCFALVHIWNNLIELNSTDRLSCEQRCESDGLGYPSYSRLESSNWSQIYSLCEEESTKRNTFVDETQMCAFPVKIRGGNRKFSRGKKDFFSRKLKQRLNFFRQIGKKKTPSSDKVLVLFK